MIPIGEFREKARSKGVPESTIERDYAQNWLLGSLSDIKMTLKGGTGIKKVYFENYRFSDDLDFTLVEKMDNNFLKELLIKAVIDVKQKSGIDFDENIKFENVPNGYESTIYFRIIRRTGPPLKIKLDITTVVESTI